MKVQIILHNLKNERYFKIIVCTRPQCLRFFYFIFYLLNCHQEINGITFLLYPEGFNQCSERRRQGASKRDAWPNRQAKHLAWSLI